VDPDFTQYAREVRRLKVKGVFISKATDEELSDMFKEMQVSLAHKVELREAVAAWRADPQRVMFPPCAAAAPAFLPLQPRAHAVPSPPPHPSRRCKPSNVKAPLKQSGSERFERRRSANKRLPRRSGSERFERRRSANKRLLKRSGSERFGRRRSASKRLLKRSGSERFGRRRSARCFFLPLHSRAPVSFVLQAAAAARIQGKPDIIEAAKSGDLSLVRDHLTADPCCIGRRDGG
jgi:hypothetical protein